jgi:signal transduction histidine kinase
MDIRDKLNTWHEQDMKMADAIHLSYFYQFFIFAFIICIFALTVWLLSRALKGSLRREEQSAGFSRSMVLAQEAERSRIARELHDQVIQDLRRLSFMGYAREAEKADPAELSSGCDTLIGRIREICHTLIPPDFERLGLLESLKNLCIGFEHTSGVECRLVAPGDLKIAPLSREMELQVYRIIQEALSNIEKHAGASEVSVALRNEDAPKGGGKTLLVCVTDDGVGFDPALAHKNANHLGIRGMYDRIAILGGKLSFESAAGAGVMVRIEVPL